MEDNCKPSKKSIQYWMRVLHRDIGFLAIGLTLVYALSGIMLIEGKSPLWSYEKEYNDKFEPGLTAAQIADYYEFTDTIPYKTENNILYFKKGTYNEKTGDATYKKLTNYAFARKMINLHFTREGSKKYTFVIIYAISLSFLAISSFWMYKPKNRNFKRGIIITAIGVAATFLLLYL